MPEDKPHRIKIKWPNGAEFEAEGTPEFIYRERREFTSLWNRPGSVETSLYGPQNALGHPNIAWDVLTEAKGRNIQLRAKLSQDKSEKDACLVLLAASQKLLNQPKPTATQLAKWLRASGYPILRMDRALQEGVAKGEILSSGSRRARRYELTAPGRLKAYILANQLTAAITGLS
ncbi:MAG: hypothetical protein HY921_09545 [Elusimicrobia bacterium]|nr:hypothetical protein [Elusimicrobiota bacterium]